MKRDEITLRCLNCINRLLSQACSQTNAAAQEVLVNEAEAIEKAWKNDDIIKLVELSVLTQSDGAEAILSMARHAAVTVRPH